MKVLLSMVLLSISILPIRAQLSDGPYILYKADSVKILRVENGKFSEESKSMGGLKKEPLQIRFSNNPKWNFEVKLKSKLDVQPSKYKQPEKMFFISDIEGEFAALRSLLIAGRVIDEQYNWIFGKGHLVICGDLFDRGKQVVEAIWLLYRLEDLAKEVGGKVHVILGNHDVMNLSGDLRYLDQKYLESAKIMGIDYMQLYDTASELGRWLRTKNIVEKIGDNLCLHAGISPQLNMLKMPIAKVNVLCRPYYDKAKSARSIADTTVAKFFSGSTSPFWYRGYFTEPKASLEEVNTTLKLYKVSRVIVGHTIVPDNVGFYYGGKVLGIDVNQHRGDHQAVLFESSKWYRMDEKGNKSELIIKSNVLK